MLLKSLLRSVIIPRLDNLAITVTTYTAKFGKIGRDNGRYSYEYQLLLPSSVLKELELWRGKSGFHNNYSRKNCEWKFFQQYSVFASFEDNVAQRLQLLPANPTAHSRNLVPISLENPVQVLLDEDSFQATK